MPLGVGLRGGQCLDAITQRLPLDRIKSVTADAAPYVDGHRSQRSRSLGDIDDHGASRSNGFAVPLIGVGQQVP